MSSHPSSAQRITWPDAAPYQLVVDVDGQGVARLVDFSPVARPAGARVAAPLPLVEVQVDADGHLPGGTPNERRINYVTSERLRYAGHAVDQVGNRSTLLVDLTDPDSGLRVTCRFEAHDGISVVRSSAEVHNAGSAPITLRHLSSFVYAGFSGTAVDWDHGPKIWLGYTGWCSEGRWRSSTPAELGLHSFGMPAGGRNSSRRRFAVTNTGSWSSSDHLPMGAVEDSLSGRCWLWQIEHNGSWQWEIGDLGGDLYLSASGPTDSVHQWSRTLAPGESFVSVPVSTAVVADGIDSAVAELTGHRRAIRRPNEDNRRLPVIFNDYMNCLEGDPTTEKLIPLIDAAARNGAEYFCIDAGWYAVNADEWWSTVGEWQEAPDRFSGGLREVTERIRAAGMVPGLWLEPEVIGEHSPAEAELPDEAYFQRLGRRLVESGRFQLDFRHPAVRERLDGVVERLITQYGIGYFKFDYNIDIGLGTDHDADSPGDGLLEHNRAYLRWLDGLLARHPGLVIENCGAGGMRMDYAMLSRLSIQSTSDQRDSRAYAVIAAAAPAMATPEQAAVWAYPQPEFSDEEIALTMVNAMLSRIHLSGRIDLLSPAQSALVTDAVDVYREIRDQLRTGVPFWPLGLPDWSDGWLSVGLICGDDTYLSVWRRDSPSAEVLLPVPNQGSATVECLYPRRLTGSYTVDTPAGGVRVKLPEPHTARLLRLRAPSSD